MKRALALLISAMLLAGCGVPSQSSPAPIPSQILPTQLQEPSRVPPGTNTTTPGRPTVQVNFVRDDKLVRVIRVAPSATLGDRTEAVVKALVAGPNSSEQASGLTTALPPDLTLHVTSFKNGRVDLELSGEADTRSATENVLTVAQIVLSMTALPGINEVTFSRGGQPVETLLADGALTTQPLTARDYAELRAR